MKLKTTRYQRKVDGAVTKRSRAPWLHTAPNNSPLPPTNPRTSEGRACSSNATTPRGLTYLAGVKRSSWWCHFGLAALVGALFFHVAPLYAQMPFYTDDTALTPTKTLHFEIFDEYDGLQSSQFPDERQNTANFKINVSPYSHIELDVDVPYLAIQRAAGSDSSHGIGDTNMGAKWNFPARSDPSAATFAMSFYVEFPTGSATRGLGSGLTDYWLNFILQKTLSETTRINGNLGILFAGNTSTGAVGIQTRRGQVYTGGISMLHDVTPRLTLGGELYGGVSDGAGGDKTQLQAMLGAQYAIRDGLTLCLGVLGGKYGATPQIGGQLGIAVDLPYGIH
jgi:hypothetical protein